MSPAAPDLCSTSERYLNKCFRQYLQSYRENYQYRWFMQDWYPCICDTIWEAYQDSYPYFRPYLTWKRPFARDQFLQFHYIKQFIKYILHKE